MAAEGVLIVGAGPAGLACGQRLAACGVPFRILEAQSAVGGRLRTELVRGFRLDRGFHVYFTAFPEGRRVLDLDALNLKPLARAVQVWFGGRFHRIADARSDPFAAVKSLFNPIGTLRDKLRLVRLHWEFDRGTLAVQLAKDERLTLDLLRWTGSFTPAMIDRFFRPLLGLFLLDSTLTASSRLFRFLVRMAMEGEVAIPASGIQAFSDQMAAGLPPGSIRLNANVERIGHREVTLADGETIQARAVVVATDGPTAARLLGSEIADPGSKAGTTLYYAADRPPFPEPILLLDGEGIGPATSALVVSNVVPESAPPGKALIAAYLVGNPAERDEELDRRVRSQFTAWFGAAVDRWELLRVYRISHAMPDQTAGRLDPWQRPVRIRPGLYVCGSHRDNATLDGALTSGFRAAQAAMEDVHEKRT